MPNRQDPLLTSANSTAMPFSGRNYRYFGWYPSVSRLSRREFANQGPPNLLFVFNERLGLLRRVVPDRHAEVRVAFLDRRRVELAKSVGETALDRLWDPGWRGKRHES